jgi:hypothetical protein
LGKGNLTLPSPIGGRGFFSGFSEVAAGSVQAAVSSLTLPSPVNGRGFYRAC